MRKYLCSYLFGSAAGIDFWKFERTGPVDYAYSGARRVRPDLGVVASDRVTIVAKFK